jgi:hypothetical protein
MADLAHKPKLAVMAGLVPAIHETQPKKDLRKSGDMRNATAPTDVMTLDALAAPRVDGRDKPGHDVAHS